jgi:hypothetical protein
LHALQLEISCNGRNKVHNLVSKQQKLLVRLTRVPPPTDFAWEDLVTLMSQCQFQAFAPAGGGSHYTFQHETGFTFSMSKTHPSGVLKAYQVKNAKEALTRVGAIKKWRKG